MPLLRRQALRAAALVVAAFLAAVVPTFAAAETAPTADEAAARAVVAGFNDALLDAMKNAKTLGVVGRYDKLAPQIKRRFNLRTMIAIATGTAWMKASAAERDKLADAFGKFSIATYAKQFDSFDGQSFQIVSATPGPRGLMIVNTQLNQPGESPVKLAYVMRKGNAGWQIIDVLVDNGISQLAVRRSEYHDVLNRKGVAGLIAELNSKTAKLLGK